MKDFREDDMRRWITVIGLLVGLVTIGSIPAVGQRVEISKERLPFQEHLVRYLDVGVFYAAASVNAPFSRRIEILNVNTVLALTDAPEHFSSTCFVRNATGAGSLLGRLPIVLKRPVEPGSSTGPVLQWFAPQPTLLHVFPDQALECTFNRYEASGSGTIAWTISGFTEFVQ
jgi:hypothetical protein